MIDGSSSDVIGVSMDHRAILWWSQLQAVLSGAIADVRHYVTAGSALDLAALDRGTSIYFPGHVVPMLPISQSPSLRLGP